MYAAHFAASLGCRAVAPRVPVIMLLVAGMAPDLTFAILMQSGVERIDAPIGASYADWQLAAPYSHGMAALVGAALLLALGLLLSRRQWSSGPWTAAIAGAVILHLVSDWCVDPSGLRLFSNSPQASGLELWRSSPNLAMLLELSVVGVGMWLFLRTAAPVSWTRRVACLGVLGWLTWGSTFGQRGVVLGMPSPQLAVPFLWQIVRDLVLVSVVALFATAPPKVRAGIVLT